MQKSILSAALAVALLSISAAPQAETTVVDFDYVSEEGTTKFISGYDEKTDTTNTLNIQTSADAVKFLAELKDAVEAKDLSGLLKAIAQVDAGEKSAILTGTTGGGTFVDSGTHNVFGLLGLFGGLIDPSIAHIGQVLSDQTVGLDKASSVALDLNGGTSILIGDGENGSEPVLIATVGGDRILNTGLADMSPSASSPIKETTISVTRKGDVLVEAESGNLFLLTGGSSAINVAGVEAQASGLHYGASAKETSATIDGSVTLNLGGHVNAGGVLAAGSAIALSGTANSTVTGDVSVKVDTEHEGANAISGVVAGLVGGGSAIGTLGGTANTQVDGKTTLDIEKGTVGGVIGGGLAAAADFTDIQDGVANILGSQYSDNLTFNDELVHQAGTAKATSKDVQIQIGSNSAVAGVIGGGAALGYQYGDSTVGAKATSEVDNVTIQIGDEDGANPFVNEDGSIDTEAKGQFFSDLKTSLKEIAGGEISFESISKLANVANQPGVTALVAGGGLAAAYDRNRGNQNVDDAFADVDATVTGDVTINVLSGYNVGIIGGGIAAASGRGDADGDPMATANVEGNTTIQLLGGETIGVLGGGIAGFAGSAEDNYTVGAQANVNKKATIYADGGSKIDGIFGGGLAVDDTNPKPNGEYQTVTNAQANVGEVSIVINDASVNVLNFKAFANIEDTDVGQKAVLSYAYTAFEAAGDNKVAIMAGGISAGLNTAEEAGATVDKATITLGSGAEVAGNVFGGGMGVAGGNSYVADSTIRIDGGKITGNVYGGGLAVGQAYLDSMAGEDFAESKANVGKSTIQLIAGEVTGDIVAGGVNDVADGTHGSAEVAEADITIWNGFTVGGNISGAGAKTAALTFVNGVDLTKAGDTETTVSSFDTLTALGGEAKGFNYDAAGKDSVSILGDGAVSISKLTNLSGVMSAGTEEKIGFLGVADWSADSNSGKISVANGVVTLGGSGDLGRQAYNGKNAVMVTGDIDVSNIIATANVDTSTVSEKGIHIGQGAELIADASAGTNVTGNTSIDENGTLRVVNVGVDLEGQTEQTVIFGSALGDVAFTWDNVLWVGTADETGSTFTFKAENTLGLDDDVYGFYNGLGSDDPLRTLIDSSNYSGEESLRAGMNLAAAAGVQAAAVEGVNQGIDAATRRASLQRIYKDGVEGFAEVTGIYSKMGGSGDMNEIKLEMGGLVAGADYTTGDWTFGGLVNAGTGTVRGQGDNGGVKNEVDYYGFELYGAKRFGDFNLVGQMGYLATSNDLSDGNLGAEVDDLDADVWTVGVRGEMKYALSAKCFVVPYVGINYLRVGTDGYTTNQGTKVDSADQNLFTMPIGAAFQGTIASTSGWNWTPSVDVAYVGAFGDREADVDTTSVTGTVGAVSMDVWSESVFRARVGLEASKDNFGVGFVAGGSFGSDDASGFFGQIRARYAF